MPNFPDIFLPVEFFKYRIYFLFLEVREKFDNNVTIIVVVIVLVFALTVIVVILVSVTDTRRPPHPRRSHPVSTSSTSQSGFPDQVNSNSIFS